MSEILQTRARGNWWATFITIGALLFVVFLLDSSFLIGCGKEDSCDKAREKCEEKDCAAENCSKSSNGCEEECACECVCDSPDGDSVDLGVLPNTTDDTGRRDENYNVVEEIWTEGDFPAAGFNAQFHPEDYLEYIEKAKEFRNPHSPEDWQDIFNNITSKDPSWRAIKSISELPINKTFRNALIEGLNLGHLIDGLNERELVVYHDSSRSSDKKIYFIFEDIYVGRFEVVYAPAKNVNGNLSPLVIGLHGHCEFGDSFIDMNSLDTLQEEGVGVIVPTFRATCGSDGNTNEDLVARSLMLEGHYMSALEIYEFLLVNKFVRYRPEIDNNRIAVLAHSMGATGGNVGIQISKDNFIAYVFDNTCNYCEPGTNWKRGLFQQNIAPYIYPYHPLVGDLSTFEGSSLRIPYNYKDSEGNSLLSQALDFILEKLR